MWQSDGNLLSGLNLMGFRAAIYARNERQIRTRSYGGDPLEEGNYRIYIDTEAGLLTRRVILPGREAVSGRLASIAYDGTWIPGRGGDRDIGRTEMILMRWAPGIGIPTPTETATPDTTETVTPTPTETVTRHPTRL